MHIVRPHHFVNYSDDVMKHEHCGEALLSHNQLNAEGVRVLAVEGHDHSSLEDSGGKGITISDVHFLRSRASRNAGSHKKPHNTLKLQEQSSRLTNGSLFVPCF